MVVARSRGRLFRATKSPRLLLSPAVAWLAVLFAAPLLLASHWPEGAALSVLLMLVMAAGMRSVAVMM